jgi:hypothetical protein
MQPEGADMIAATTPDCLPCELDSRNADGIEVALLWSKLTNRLWVSVIDTRTGESFELDVKSHNALDVFHHPFAYAVRRSADSLEPVLGASLS